MKYDKQLQELENYMKELGIEIKTEKKQVETNNSWIKGKIFNLIGSFHSYKDEELANLIKSKGGRIGKRVTENTDYILVGDCYGWIEEDQLDHAKYLVEEYGYKAEFINEDEFHVEDEIDHSTTQQYDQKNVILIGRPKKDTLIKLANFSYLYNGIIKPTMDVTIDYVILCDDYLFDINYIKYQRLVRSGYKFNEMKEDYFIESLG